MSAAIRFLWVATRGYRLSPWRSPFLKWRIETYSGLPASRVGFASFWKFVWSERRRLGTFLGWTNEMAGWEAKSRSRA
jgi:hypothetical protein